MKFLIGFHPGSSKTGFSTDQNTPAATSSVPFLGRRAESKLDIRNLDTSIMVGTSDRLRHEVVGIRTPRAMPLFLCFATAVLSPRGKTALGLLLDLWGIAIQ